MRTGHRRAHLRIWLAMLVVLPALLAGGLALRDGGSAEAPRLLSPPGPPR
jgi:hypothetical protein